MDALELLANNLANSATSGYKSDREFYGLFTGQADDLTGDGSSSLLPVIERQWTDFSQGILQPTGNPLDIALSGKGFLTVNSPSGVLYTRNGNLRISFTGELVTSEGFTVRDVEGKSIRVTSGKPIEISTDGVVRQDGKEVGKLEVVQFKNTDSLRKLSGACFRNADRANTLAPATGVEIQQGRLEASNVAVPEAAMRLVGMMRQFEMLQKAVSMGVDMNRRAIEEVAKVSG